MRVTLIFSVMLFCTICQQKQIAHNVWNFKFFPGFLNDENWYSCKYNKLHGHCVIQNMIFYKFLQGQKKDESKPFAFISFNIYNDG